MAPYQFTQLTFEASYTDLVKQSTVGLEWNTEKLFWWIRLKIGENISNVKKIFENICRFTSLIGSADPDTNLLLHTEIAHQKSYPRVMKN